MNAPRRDSISSTGYLGLGIALVLFGAIAFGLLSSGALPTARLLFLGLLGLPLGAVAIIVGIVKRSRV